MTKHVRKFLLTGFLAWLVGVSIGTAFYLIWMDVTAILDGDAWNDAVGRVMLLPIALPVILAISFPIAIVPTYIFGWLISILLRWTHIQNVIVRCCFGGTIGGIVGWGMLSRLQEGGTPGLIYGGAIGAAWFACEKWQSTIWAPGRA